MKPRSLDGGPVGELPMTDAPRRGTIRETSLDLSIYFSDHYFSLPQLFSMSQQIHEIHKLRPTSIIEIGIGNGLTSWFLRRAGYSVTTVDINPSLEPDICAPLAELKNHLGTRRFDLVVCCEVLEHMPLAELQGSLDTLRSAGERLFLTLPNCQASIGFGGLLRLPKRDAKLVGGYLNINRAKRMDGEHFWEVGSEPATSKREIVRQLQARYSTVEFHQFELNPYHLAFYAH